MKALSNWEDRHGKSPTEAEVVKLIMEIPLITTMDGTQLNLLTKCTHLSLSTNAIDKMKSLNLRNLKILSLARNKIKRIAGLDEIGGTLEQLWLSYNIIDKLDGLHQCSKLEVLYMSNNRISKWDEIDKLVFY